MQTISQERFLNERRGSLPRGSIRNQGQSKRSSQSGNSGILNISGSSSIYSSIISDQGKKGVGNHENDPKTTQKKGSIELKKILKLVGHSMVPDLQRAQAQIFKKQNEATNERENCEKSMQVLVQRNEELIRKNMDLEKYVEKLQEMHKMVENIYFL